MALERLGIRNFRCFSSADIVLSPHGNFIVGANASGKTSLLEAIFFLSRGRSFRTSQHAALIRSGEGGFQVFGRVGTTPLGIERNAAGMTARLGGAPAPSRAALTETLPVQIINAQSHLLIEGGPAHRRRFLDWGAFHVERLFWPAWRRYHRCLRQRNALLRVNVNQRVLESWTAEMAESGCALDEARAAYFARWFPTATELAGEMLNTASIELQYRQGWPRQYTLEEALMHSLSRDRKTGVTQVGPHRAGFSIRVNQVPARARISRGQQKALAAAFLLAQASVHRTVCNHSCTLLIDDAAAELDRTHLERIYAVLGQAGAQTVMTAIDAEALPTSWIDDISRFHVEQAQVKEMV